MLKFYRETVIALADGERASCRVAACDCCEARHFSVFQLDGKDHLHFQCVTCGMSFCPHGTCDSIETVTGLAEANPPRVMRTCSWCHTENPITARWCRRCKHAAHLPRVHCDCATCQPPTIQGA